MIDKYGQFRRTAQCFQPKGAGPGIKVKNLRIFNLPADNAEKSLTGPVRSRPDEPAGKLCRTFRGCLQAPASCLASDYPQLQIIPGNYFSDLYCIQGRSLQYIVGNDPEIYAVFYRRVLPYPADQGFKFAGTIQGQGIYTQAGLVNNLDSRSSCEKLPYFSSRDLSFRFNIY